VARVKIASFEGVEREVFDWGLGLQIGNCKLVSSGQCLVARGRVTGFR
jgi:hypothetical protein